ncbi:MAG: ExbD/TolR family protein [Deltaproteobacteria bacterium]|nr:ExbD/TolR family protein [Deltaproteobacteria bacterium]
MGANVKADSGGKGGPSAVAEINVTPLVDVMLVLLIVFMVASPMMQTGVAVDLPKASAAPIEQKEKITLTISIDAAQRIIIEGNAIPPKDLQKVMKARLDAEPKLEVNVEADSKIEYGFVAQVMAVIRGVGISKVGLVTQPGQGNDFL